MILSGQLAKCSSRMFDLGWIWSSCDNGNTTFIWGQLFIEDNFHDMFMKFSNSLKYFRKLFQKLYASSTGGNQVDGLPPVWNIILMQEECPSQIDWVFFCNWPVGMSLVMETKMIWKCATLKMIFMYWSLDFCTVRCQMIMRFRFLSGANFFGRGHFQSIFVFFKEMKFPKVIQKKMKFYKLEFPWESFWDILWDV